MNITCLRGTLRTCSLSKTAAGFFLGLMTSAVWGFKNNHNASPKVTQVYSTRREWIPSCGVSQIQSESSLVAHRIASGAHVAWQFSTVPNIESRLGKTVIVPYPAPGCLHRSSSSRKASHQGGNFRFVSWYLCVLQPECGLSSAVSSHCWVMAGSQEQEQ